MTVVKDIDRDLALATICGCVQTYRAYDAGDAFAPDPLKFVTAPPGWTFRDYWYGQDVFDGKPIHRLVVFGLVFEKDDGSGDFLFAFRGTEGIHEWIDDLDVPRTRFRPFHPDHGPAVPSDARAEDGFSEIYASMQSALFGLLARYQPKRVVITGHSLGSSLCQLFTLDVVISQPSLAHLTLDFAAPRTGNLDFADFYDTLTQEKGNPTVRVVNTKDVVPCLPPTVLGYRHVGEWFPICFQGTHGLLPNLGLRHSADNYFRTLCRVFERDDCQCRLRPPEPELDVCTPDPERECGPLANLLADETRGGSGPLDDAFPHERRR